MTFFVTLGTTVALYVVEPKGFSPQQDTGIIAGLADASQDVSFREMVRLQHSLTHVIARDPDVASWATAVGSGGRPLKNDFVVIGVKPRSERKASADQIVARLRGNFASVSGATFFCRRPRT